MMTSCLKKEPLGGCREACLECRALVQNSNNLLLDWSELETCNPHGVVRDSALWATASGEQPFLFGEGMRTLGSPVPLGASMWRASSIEASGLGQGFMQVFLVVAHQE